MNNIYTGEVDYIPYETIIEDRKELVSSITDVYVEYKGNKYRNLDEIDEYIVLIYPEHSVFNTLYSSGIWFKAELIRKVDGEKFDFNEIFREGVIKVEFKNEKNNSESREGGDME